MNKIYGHSFLPVSDANDIFGNFQDGLKGRARIFLDEAMFAGDHRALNRAKTLSTTTRAAINCKGVPVITLPVAFNFWAASNDSNPVKIEEYDERYWILHPSEHRVGDTNYFNALTYEIDHSGAEAFAYYLANLDVSDFIPWRDVKRDNAAKRQMIADGFNPYDARVWLKQCALTEMLLGANWVRDNPADEDTPEVRRCQSIAVKWTEGAEFTFAEMSAAYTEWMKSVRSPMAPQPTPTGNLGEAMARAGIPVHKTKHGNLRVLPAPEKCLEALAKLAKDRVEEPRRPPPNKVDPL